MEEIYTESLEQTRKGDYIDRGLHGEGRGIYTERRLYRKGTTRRRERDLHGDGIYTETEQARRGDYREGTTWSGDYMKRGLHGKGTTWRGERGHIRRGKYMRRARLCTKREQHGVGRGDIHENGEETTWRREGTYTERVHKKIRV